MLLITTQKVHSKQMLQLMLLVTSELTLGEELNAEQNLLTSLASNPNSTKRVLFAQRYLQLNQKKLAIDNVHNFD